VSERPLSVLLGTLADVAEQIAAAAEARDMTDQERAKIGRFVRALQEVSDAAQALHEPQGKPS
jgi:hypothetical protein